MIIEVDVFIIIAVVAIFIAVMAFSAHLHVISRDRLIRLLMENTELEMKIRKLKSGASVHSDNEAIEKISNSYAEAIKKASKKYAENIRAELQKTKPHSNGTV